MPFYANNDSSFQQFSLMNYKYQLLLGSTQMERFNRYGPKIVKIAVVLLVISISFITFVIAEGAALNSDQIALNDLETRSIQNISCSQLCSNLVIEQSGLCCDSLLASCSSKSACYQSKISEYHASINQQSDFIEYFCIPAFFFFFSFLVAVCYFFKLKQKKRQQEMLVALQNQLIAQQDFNQMGYDYEDLEQFENYNAFVQFMIEHGYFYQIPANQKKGDPKITDSFATNDDTTCPICMMEYREEKVLKLRCNHKFHSSCIRDWNQANSSCPVCRYDIFQ